MPRGVGQFAALTSLSLVTLAGTLHAQDFEGKNISEVAIRYTGAKTVDEARLRNLMATKAGTVYRAESLDNDIKSLYESGLVDDVRFLAEPVGGSVKLIAEVTTRPGLGGVGFVPGRGIALALASNRLLTPGTPVATEHLWQQALAAAGTAIGEQTA